MYFSEWLLAGGCGRREHEQVGEILLVEIQVVECSRQLSLPCLTLYVLPQNFIASSVPWVKGLSSEAADIQVRMVMSQSQTPAQPQAIPRAQKHREDENTEVSMQMGAKRRSKTVGFWLRHIDTPATRSDFKPADGGELYSSKKNEGGTMWLPQCSLSQFPSVILCSHLFKKKT